MKHSKRWQQLEQENTETLNFMYDSLTLDVQNRLDLAAMEPHIKNGGRLWLIALLEKEALLRKYAAWLRKNDGYAHITLTYRQNRLRVVYRYSLNDRPAPLPPSTRFDQECACWRCGKPAPWRWRCRAANCNAYVCGACTTGSTTDRCPLHDGVTDYKAPDYKPTTPHRFTVGLEIETERALSATTRHTMCTSPLIAGWSSDPSLPDNALEYQTQPLTPADMEDIVRLIKRLPACALGKAGGHMHVSRTPRQTCGRWYHALNALTPSQARALNMRHHDENRWCRLQHGRYQGKSTAVNGEHEATIELRTFGHWDRGTVDKLTPAVTWVHAMWRMFEKVAKGRLKVETIRAYSSRTAARLLEKAEPLDARLAAYKTERETEREQRRIDMRLRIVRNVEWSRRARQSHGGDLDRRLWLQSQERKQLTRNHIYANSDSPYTCYVWPHDKHAAAKYVRHAIKYGERATYIADKVTGVEVAIPNRRMAERVAANVLQARRAKASHGASPSYCRRQLFRIFGRRLNLRVDKSSVYGLYVLSAA